MTVPGFGGRLATDSGNLDRYASDMSRYHVRPQMVAWPGDQEDVDSLLRWCQAEGVSLTCRGAGSNLSGSAVGPGVIAVLSELDGIKSRTSQSVVVGPGVRYQDLNVHLEPQGFCLRYDVSSGRFSSIGGNVATKAGGLRSVKYGNVDASVASLRFINPVHGLVDTAEGLPKGLEVDIEELHRRILGDGPLVSALQTRGDLKTSSGYNLQSFLRYQRADEIVTHLLVGSAGTLGVITEIAMTPVPIPRERRLALIALAGLRDACEVAPELVALGPSALELMDDLGANLVGADGAAVLLLEFDCPGPGPGGDECDSDDCMNAARRVCGERCLQWTEMSGLEAETLWDIRWSMLTRIRREYEDDDHRFLSFVDDLAVPLSSLTGYVDDIQEVFRKQDLPVVIYGHVGEGNLHMRPLIPRDGWQQRVHALAESCFEAALSRGGTLTAEHGSGRNRAPFLEREWGSAVMDVFRRIKKIFDPDDLLNPGVLFSDQDFTERMQF